MMISTIESLCSCFGISALVNCTSFFYILIQYVALVSLLALASLDDVEDSGKKMICRWFNHHHGIAQIYRLQKF